MSHANGTINGNGTNGSTLAKRPPPPADQLPAVAAGLMELPPWMKALRTAMSDAIKPDDVAEVMAAQVKKAKGGDMAAARFVMDQAHKLMDAHARHAPPVTIVQNNYHDSPRPAAAIEPGDGEDDVLLKRRSRARAGLPLTTEADRRVRPVGDEEEKELRRQWSRREADDEDRGPEAD